jgi:hypothetical protein
MNGQIPTRNASFFAKQSHLPVANEYPKMPEERAEIERAPPLTSHNRPGKRFAAFLDFAPHKPNQMNDKEPKGTRCASRRIRTQFVAKSFSISTRHITAL